MKRQKREPESWELRFPREKRSRFATKRATESLHRAHLNFQRERLMAAPPIGSHSMLRIDRDSRCANAHFVRDVTVKPNALECPTVRGEHWEPAAPAKFQDHWIKSDSRKFNVRPNFWKALIETDWYFLNNPIRDWRK